MICKEPECGADVEANVSAGLELHEDGSWELVYMGDDHGSIQCTEGHDNSTTALEKSLSAYIDEILPGTTWQGSDPRLQSL